MPARLPAAASMDGWMETASSEVRRAATVQRNPTSTRLDCAMRVVASLSSVVLLIFFPSDIVFQDPSGSMTDTTDRATESNRVAVRMIWHIIEILVKECGE